MELSESLKDGVIILQPHGRIDNNSVKLFGDRVVELIHSGSHRVVIDFQQTSFISSAGFRPLLTARKLMDQLQGKLVLCGMSAEIQRVFEIGAFTDLFVICGTRDEGVNNAQR